MVYSLSGTSYWDPNIILNGAIGGGYQPKQYFSNYPNTLMLLYMEHFLWLLLGKPTLEVLILVFNYINIIVIDFGMVMIANIADRWFGRQYILLVTVSIWYMFLVTPWVALTYTDTWAFMLTALNLWLITNYYYSHRLWKRYLYAGLLGLSFAVSYYLKPSLLIVFVAYFIIYSLYFLGERRKIQDWLTVGLSLIFGLIVVAGICTAFHVYTNNQRMVVVDPSLSHPVTHFIAMGMTGTGGYTLSDVQLDERIKSPKKRRAVNTQLIKTRLSAFGPANYFKFLVNKQVANTSDASFGWGQDGTFLVVNKMNDKGMVSVLPRKLYTQNGVALTTSYEYRFAVQIAWSMALFCLLLGVGLKSWKIQFLKYSIVGGMLFLLIFEGGRSRYMIQFLPIILILAAVSGQKWGEWVYGHFRTDREK
ncbi:hypothetical protein ACFQH1_02615 [Lactiplantibacillus daoliensis]|uniref:Glycosyltransferase RgtA/B/C/D-like domain-containing protein n=1 Tax=Lactiplantibacillus daoliensis TaxID=2559916 RepID=A0ABW1UFQ4_9LACO